MSRRVFVCVSGGVVDEVIVPPQTDGTWTVIDWDNIEADPAREWGHFDEEDKKYIRENYPDDCTKYFPRLMPNTGGASMISTLINSLRAFKALFDLAFSEDQFYVEQRAEFLGGFETVSKRQRTVTTLPHPRVYTSGSRSKSCSAS
jgi:hypothetical protein